MSDKKCGCGPSSNSDPTYLMVEATASEAAVCDPNSIGNSSSCENQERTYDESISDFVVPLSTNTTSMQVCNPSVYAVGQWLYFNSSKAYFQINNITGQILTLVNRCPNDDAIDGNPAPGTPIPSKSKFVVSASPPCFAIEAETDRVKRALASMTQICVPDLIETTNNQNIQVVGRVSSDSSNPSQGKCIRRIADFFFKLGRPFMSGLRTINVNSSQYDGYRRLARHTATNEIVELINFSNMPDAAGVKQKAYSVTSSNEKLVGPAYFGSLFRHTLEKNTNDEDPDNWPVIDTTIHKEYDLSTISAIENIVKNQDHYYAMVRLEISARHTGDDYRTLVASLGGDYAGKAIARTGGLVAYNSISMPVKVLYADHKLELDLEADGAMKCYFRIVIDGIYL